MKRFLKPSIFVLMIIIISSCSNNSTVKEAIANNAEWNNDGLQTVYLNNDIALIFMEHIEGKVEAGTVVKSNHGWKPISRTGTLYIWDNSIGFGGMSGSLKVKDNDFIVLTWGLIVDEDIEKILIKGNENKKVNILETTNGTRIYYIVDKATKRIASDYTLLALSKKGKVLYQQPKSN